jgi:hypothetical protein
MNSDHFFAIGSTHKVCQDYALSGNYKGFYYAIVSDGCSSSPDSDFGSRILVKILEKNIKDSIDWKSNNILSIKDYIYHDRQKIFEYIIEYLKIKDDLELNSVSLDATLLYIISDGKNSIICVWGDGAFLIKYKNNYMKFVNIKYPSGYPFYINYHKDNSRLDEFISQSKVRQTDIHIEYPHLDKFITMDRIETEMNINNDRNDSTLYPIQYTIPNTGEGITENIDIESVSIISDGINSFYQTNTNDTSIVAKDLSSIDIVKKMLSYKNFNGQFVQRRMQAFQKDCKKNNIEHQDDLSVATICF